RRLAGIVGRSRRDASTHHEDEVSRHDLFDQVSGPSLEQRRVGRHGHSIPTLDISARAISSSCAAYLACWLTCAPRSPSAVRRSLIGAWAACASGTIENMFGTTP